MPPSLGWRATETPGLLWSDYSFGPGRTKQKSLLGGVVAGQIGRHGRDPPVPDGVPRTGGRGHLNPCKSLCRRGITRVGRALPCRGAERIKELAAADRRQGETLRHRTQWCLARVTRGGTRADWSAAKDRARWRRPHRGAAARTPNGPQSTMRRCRIHSLQPSSRRFVRPAYHRTDLFDRRRELTNSWSIYATAGVADGSVDQEGTRSEDD